MRLTQHTECLFQHLAQHTGSLLFLLLNCQKLSSRLKDFTHPFLFLLYLSAIISISVLSFVLYNFLKRSVYVFVCVCVCMCVSVLTHLTEYFEH